MRISDAELEVMEVLWANRRPLTATEVAQHIDLNAAGRLRR